jgi:hypothetical protein
MMVASRTVHRTSLNQYPRTIAWPTDSLTAWRCSVGIALGAVAALTRQRVIWLGSGILGLLGAAMCGLTLIR